MTNFRAISGMQHEARQRMSALRNFPLFPQLRPPLGEHSGSSDKDDKEWFKNGGYKAVEKDHSCECIKLNIVDSGGGTIGRMMAFSLDRPSLNPGMDLGFFQLN